MVGVVTIQGIAPHAGSDGCVVFLLDLVVGNPHIVHFDALFFAFLSWGGLGEGDLHHGVVGELIDAVYVVDGEFVDPIDLSLDLLLRMTSYEVIHSEDHNGSS